MRKFLSILKKKLILLKDIFFKTNFLLMNPTIDLTIKYTKNENTKIYVMLIMIN